MINTDNKIKEAQSILQQLLESKQFYFRDLVPSMLDKVAGVYAIFDTATGKTLYVGRTINIRRRLYTNHLMGPEANARLKKYLKEDKDRPDIPNMSSAKQYLIDNCYFQYLPIEETIPRARIEGLLSFLLDVVYMHKEH